MKDLDYRKAINVDYRTFGQSKRLKNPKAKIARLRANGEPQAKGKVKTK